MQSLEIQLLTPVAGDGLSATSATFLQLFYRISYFLLDPNVFPYGILRFYSVRGLVTKV